MWTVALCHDFRVNLNGHLREDIPGTTALCWVARGSLYLAIKNLKTLSIKIIEYNFPRLASSDPVLQLGFTHGSFQNIPK